MMPPTSIDGTDITGATIDGTDVQEITVDGDTVFSAQTLPVAYSNLITWYPFDSATYGGSNADDVTAIIGGSGDDTAYDGTLNGATYQSGGGVTDINAGANSGAFDFDGSNDFIAVPSNGFDSTQTFSISMWINADSNATARIFNTNDNVNGFRLTYRDGQIPPSAPATAFEDSNNRDDFAGSPTFGTGTWAFVCITFDDNISEAKAYLAANNVSFTNFSTISTSGSGSDPIGPNLGGISANSEFFNGRIDDLRIYNTALSSSQVNQIYLNTEP